MGLEINSEIKLDLQNPGAPRIVHAKQGETVSRFVSIKLYDGDVAWTIPNYTTFEASYVKPDGKGGTYSSVDAGSGPISAITASGNTLRVLLAPQALQCAGLVKAEVHMKSGDAMLSTFTFYVSVQASAENDITSEDYWNAAASDKVVLLDAAIGTTADVSSTHDIGEFHSTPRVGDVVLGTDGAIADVSVVLGDNVTITASGEKWVDFNPAVYAMDVKYEVSLPGVGTFTNVSGALNWLLARNILIVRGSVDFSDGDPTVDCETTSTEIAAAMLAERMCIGYFERVGAAGGGAIIALGVNSSAGLSFRVPTVTRSGVTMEEIKSSANYSTWSYSKTTLDQYPASYTAYQNRINGEEVMNVTEALDALAALTGMIQSVEALPENPDPNVLYLIRDEDGG